MAVGTTGSRDAGGDPGAAEVADLSYAVAGAELDAIIQEFETGVVDVDRLVSQLERATDIVDELDRRLRGTRMRVEELVPRLEAIGREESRDADEADQADRADRADRYQEPAPNDEDGDSSGSQGLF